MVASAFDIIFTKDSLFLFQLSHAKSEYESRTLHVKDIFDFETTMDAAKLQKNQQQYGDCGYMIQNVV